jgi:protein phosphatase
VEILVGVRSDVGLVRMNNEDHFAVDPSLGLYVICDGMGGQAAGEVASKMAVETVVQHIREAGRNPQANWEGAYLEELSAPTNRLGSAIRLSNKAIFDAAASASSNNGMGCTVAAASILGNVMSVAHVGDSRIYLFRDGKLKQLTQDHSLVWEQVRQGLLTPQEAGESDMSNVILRALGAEPTVEVDLDEMWVGPGDQVLLCSDGLTRMVPDAEIAAVLAAAAEPQEAADKLVQLANEKGGEDNTTVIILRLLPSSSGWKRLVRSLRGGDQEWRN